MRFTTCDMCAQHNIKHPLLPLCEYNLLYGRFHCCVFVFLAGQIVDEQCKGMDRRGEEDEAERRRKTLTREKLKS